MSNGNRLLKPSEMADGMLQIVRKQIKEMREEGMTEKQIQTVINAVFGGFMYGPL